MDKTELLNWLMVQDQQWEDLLGQVGPAQMEQPGVNGDWSMKDMVAHLTGWNRYLVARIQAAERGEPEPPPPWPAHLKNDEEINAWIFDSNHPRPVKDVLDDARFVFEQLFAAIRDLPDGVRIEPEWHLVWLGDQRFEVGEFFDHLRDDHEPDIRVWLASAEKR